MAPKIGIGTQENTEKDYTVSGPYLIAQIRSICALLFFCFFLISNIYLFLFLFASFNAMNIIIMFPAITISISIYSTSILFITEHSQLVINLFVVGSVLTQNRYTIINTLFTIYVSDQSLFLVGGPDLLLYFFFFYFYLCFA